MVRIVMDFPVAGCQNAAGSGREVRSVVSPEPEHQLPTVLVAKASRRSCQTAAVTARRGELSRSKLARMIQSSLYAGHRH